MSSFKAGKSGDYTPPKPTNTLQDKQFTRKESAGVETGLSARESCDAEYSAPEVDYQRDPMTGNATERIKPREYSSVKEKGKSFQVEK